MTDDTFGRFYAGVNLEWPQFGMTEDEARLQEKRWRSVLGTFSDAALGHAFKQAVRTAKKRPRAAEFVEWAGEATVRTPYARPEVPHTHCDCGCGGRRWYLVLRDHEGTLRHYAASVQEMTDTMPHHLARNPVVAAAFERLAGQPMLRLRNACRKTGGDPMPDLAYRVGEEDGITVYDIRRTA
jgi:hypothetical protein